MPRFAVLYLCITFTLQASSQTGPWHDPSPHKTLFIQVEPGVRLEVLDWGGRGEPILLLAGDGDTAHVFDDFAPQLARHFHVFGLTRRGFGASSQPNDGYDLTRLVKDIVSVADALKIQRFTLVGHSIAGDEMNRTAQMFPERVRKLVYLEAAYDRVDSERMEAGFHLPHRLEQPTSSDLASPSALTAYLRKTECPGFPESEVRATRIFAPDGRYIRPITPDSILARVAGMVEHPSYGQIHSPALAIYAVKKTPEQLFPVYASADFETQAALKDIFTSETSFQKQQRQRFVQEMHGSQAVEISGSNHYIFISNANEVLRDIDSFLLQN